MCRIAELPTNLLTGKPVAFNKKIFVGYTWGYWIVRRYLFNSFFFFFDVEFFFVIFYGNLVAQAVPVNPVIHCRAWVVHKASGKDVIVHIIVFGWLVYFGYTYPGSFTLLGYNNVLPAICILHPVTFTPVTYLETL